MKKLNLVGAKFGKWTVLGWARVSKHKKNLWKCVCECGSTSEISVRDLTSGKSKSCGCVRDVAFGKSMTTHGETRSRIISPDYTCWFEMKRRCYTATCSGYKNYGGRGIKVSDRWLNSFDNFLADMGRRPEGCSINRINNNGNYEPSNCKWSTRREQMANTRRSRWIEFRGKKMILADWARELGVGVTWILYRLGKGLRFEQIVSQVQK